MKRIRKGNDINLIWEIYGEIDGIKSPYDLSGKKLSLYMSTLYGKEEVKDFTTEENMVIWSFRGKDQKHLGVYTLTLVENEADNFMHTVDECKAFEIVSHSCITDADGEDIRITTELNIGAITPDTSLNPDSLNVVTNAAICAALDAFQDEVNARLTAFEEATGADISAYKEQINSLFEAFQADIEARMTSAAEDNATFKADIESAFDTFKESVSSEITTALQEQNDYIAREVQNQKEEISKGFTQQNNKIAEEFAQQDAEIAKKVSYDGKYPQLTSGFANNLVGRGESTESEFSFRASGGKSIEDGAARISELRGNGVVWNQGLKYALSQADTGKNGWWSRYTGNGLPQLDGRKITFFAGDGNYPFIAQERKIVKGHTYLISFDFTTEFTDAYRRAYQFAFSMNAYGNIAQGIYGPQDGLTSGHCDSFVVANDNYSHFLWWVSVVGLSSKPASTATLENYQLIDLTLMFGAGNEPTTIEEFYARKPIGVDEYAYNEGTLIPFNADAIKSVGFNAWDEKWEVGTISSAEGENVANDTIIRSKGYIKVLPNEKYLLPILLTQKYQQSAVGYFIAYYYDGDYEYIGNYRTYSNWTTESHWLINTPPNCQYIRFATNIEGATYNNDICIHLVHTGYRNGEYQPYEDFVRAIDPRIKEAFPNGMKPWDKVYNKNGKGYIVKGSGEVDLGSLNYMYQAPITGTYPLGYFNTMIDGKATGNSNLLCGKYSTIADWTSIGVRGSESSAYVYIKDSAYTDAAAFKAAMAGVPLWYELAEQEVIEYDEPFNLDYEVWDFGTEEIIASEPCAPISADIIYQFNAVDTIRNNQIEIANLKAMIATMQSQMASLTNKE